MQGEAFVHATCVITYLLCADQKSAGPAAEGGLGGTDKAKWCSVAPSQAPRLFAHWNNSTILFSAWDTHTHTHSGWMNAGSVGGRGDRKYKCTHQLEILDATDEVGGVGPPALDVDTVCTGRQRRHVT